MFHLRLNALGIALVMGCTGTVGDPRSGGDPASSDPSATAGRAMNAGGRAAAGTSGSAGAGTTAACLADALPPVRAWKLTREQYLASVAGFTGGAAVSVDIPADGLTAGFDTSDANEVTPLHAEAYQAYAEAAATIAAGQAALAFSCLGKTGSPDDACVSSFVTSVARKAYRRPLVPDEATRYAGFFRKAETGFGKAEAIKMTYEAALQSPSFVFRWEVGAGDSTETIALTPHELASELSYLIADVPPSPEILAAADDGTLMRGEVREKLARDLLSRPSARSKMARFFASYLHLNDLAQDNRTKDPVTFPQFTPALKQQMIDATAAFVDRELWDASGTLVSLFTAPYAYTTPDLAPLLGVARPTAAGLTKVALDAKQRAGVVAQPAVIAALSSQKSTSPVHRGLFFARTMLCQEPPPPLAGAEAMAKGTLVSNDAMATQRENWDFATRNSSARVCVACHKAFHPLGLSLENYDAIGQYRATEYGKPLDVSGELTGWGPDLDGGYSDGASLAKKIVESRIGQACFVSRVTQFSFGRALDEQGETSCSTLHTVDRFRAANLSPTQLLIALTQDEAFTHRRRTVP